MKSLHVKNQWFIESDLRLDAAYHLSDGPIAKAKLKFSPYDLTTLKNECDKIFSGNIFKRTYVESAEHGWPYLTGSDMVKADINSGKYISKKSTGQAENLRIKKDWILISCSGTLGNCVFTNTNFEGRIGTHDLIRVIPNEKSLKKGYLYAYLSSRHGYGLLTQSSYGGVVKHIEPHHIENIPIPILHEIKQQEIHNLVVEASNLRVDANKLLSESINEIESQFIFEKPKTNYSVNIRDILKGDKYTKESRLEADYYQPSTYAIESQILALPHALLGDLSKEVTISNLRGRTFVENGVTLITGQSLGLLKPDLSKQLSRKLTRNIEKNITLDGDVLVSAFGTLGKVEYCFKNFYSGVFASQQLARIRVDKTKIDEGYIYLFLKSRVGQSLIQKFKTGSVIEWANWNNFCSVLIPIPEDKGKRLGEIARQIALKFQQAYILETKAIELVENEIESWQKL
jgi:restriction endonuclease S subunit